VIIRRIPINALQKSIYEILTTKQTTPVYDSIPKDAVFPYIIISDYEFDIGGSKNVDICKVTFELEIWTKYEGKAEVNSIAEDMTNVLTAWPIDLSAENFNVLSQSVKGGKGARQDGYFYGIVYFTAEIQNLGKPN
jgi:hypothetical protein